MYVHTSNIHISIYNTHVHIHIYTYTQTKKPVGDHEQRCTHPICTYAYTIHMYIYTCVHIYIYIYIYTHTQIKKPAGDMNNDAHIQYAHILIQYTCSHTHTYVYTAMDNDATVVNHTHPT